MISINCTNCKAELSIDEAFAGGVCRCQFCGTIQTVPRHLRGGDGSGVMAQAAAGKSPKSLYTNRSRVDVGGSMNSPSSGLDEIADRVAGGGLPGNPPGGAGRTATRSRPATKAAGNPVVPLVVGAAGLIIALLGVVIWLLVRNSDSGSGTGGQGTNSQPNNTQISGIPTPGSQTPGAIVPTPAPAPSGAQVPTPPRNTAIVTPPLPPSPAKLGPNFLGVKITEPVVVFVIDRGGANIDTLDYAKLACLKALDSMRPDQKFMVIFWKGEKDRNPLIAPPGNAPVTVSRDSIQKAEVVMDNINAVGSTDVKAAIDKAFSVNPAAVILMSSKVLLDDNFVKTVLASRKTSTAKIHAFAMAEPSSAKAMQDIASKTGGTSRVVTLEELHSVSR